MTSDPEALALTVRLLFEMAKSVQTSWMRREEIGRVTGLLLDPVCDTEKQAQSMLLALARGVKSGEIELTLERSPL